MAKAEKELSAVAKLYARSLFQLALKRDELDEVESDFTSFVDYLNDNPAFKRFLESHTVDKEARRAALERVLRGRINDLLLNTMLVMNDKGRSEFVEAVCMSFLRVLEEHRGQVEVHIASAVKLTSASREMIRTAVSEMSGKDPIFFEKIDESLIGGLVMRIGDRQIDASVARKLAILKKSLLDRASHEILSGRTYFEA